MQKKEEGEGGNRNTGFPGTCHHRGIIMYIKRAQIRSPTQINPEHSRHFNLTEAAGGKHEDSGDRRTPHSDLLPVSQLCRSVTLPHFTARCWYKLSIKCVCMCVFTAPVAPSSLLQQCCSNSTQERIPKGHVKYVAHHDCDLNAIM